MKKKFESQLQEQLQEMESDSDFGDLDEIDEDFSGMFDTSDMENTNEVSEEEASEGNERKKASMGQTSQEELDKRIEEELESKTDKVLTKKLEEMADDKTDYMYYHLDENYAFDPFVSFKTIIEETKATDDAYTDVEYGPRNTERLNKFKTDSTRVVNYLIKEFEMRKSATLYKRAQTSKIGQLDMRKVWSYKLNDDLFKRVTTIPQGKNHGMIFLLDWSGSMNEVIQETIEQVVTLAMFCHRAQIPYQVFAFISQYDIFNSRNNAYEEYNKYKELCTQERPGNVLSNGIQNFALLELMSNKMSSVEFNTMVRRLMVFYKFATCKHHEYSLSGTPLNEAIAYMFKQIPKFIAANKVEKMSFITLTDGEGGSLSAMGRRYLDEYRYEHDEKGQYVKIKQVHFLQDSVTKKTYPLSRNPAEQTESLIRMVKDRFGVSTVGFYITNNTRNYLESVIRCNIPGYTGSTYALIENMRKDFRDQGFSSIKSSGRDDLFIVPAESTKIDESELKVESDMSARRLATSLGKFLNTKKTSRILLSRFIGYVA